MLLGSPPRPSTSLRMRLFSLNMRRKISVVPDLIGDLVPSRIQASERGPGSSPGLRVSWSARIGLSSRKGREPLSGTQSFQVPALRCTTAGMTAQFYPRIANASWHPWRLAGVKPRPPWILTYVRSTGGLFRRCPNQKHILAQRPARALAWTFHKSSPGEK